VATPAENTAAKAYSFNSFLGIWFHFAVTRDSGNIRFFIDGTMVTTSLPVFSIPGTIGSSSDLLNIGGVGTGDTGNSVYKSLVGYLTNFRWIKGTALYTTDFPKPTAELQPITNTRLLLLVNNEAQNPSGLPPLSDPTRQTIRDSSVNNYVVTRNPTAPNGNVAWSPSEYPLFTSPFGKANAIDGNNNTIMVGATRKDIPNSGAKFIITTNFQNTATQISTLRIQNIPSTSNFMRGSGFGNNEMTSTLLRVGENNAYFSTIYLNNNLTQSFFF
jgi:hypothetical protein